MKNISKAGAGRLVTELICRGIRYEHENKDDNPGWKGGGRGGHSGSGRQSGRSSYELGAGPTPTSKTFVLPHEIFVEIPIEGHFIERSPFSFETENGKNGAGHVLKNGEELCRAYVPRPPDFLNGTTSDGLRLKNIIKTHGRENVAATPYRPCDFWKKEQQCRFCTIYYNDSSPKVKQPTQVAEAAAAAWKEHYSSLVLSSGTAPEEIVAKLYCGIALETEDLAPDMAVHAQIPPIEDFSWLWDMAYAGIDTLGCHIDIWPERLRKRITPGKAKIKKASYIQTWRQAVRLFGPNQVSTFLLAGFGETEKEMTEGFDEICSLGVIPYLLPHRPLPKTQYEGLPPISPEKFIVLAGLAKDAMNSYGIDIKENLGGCMTCGSCSPLHAILRYGAAEEI